MAESLEEKTVEELKDLARERGLSGFSTMNKSELVELVESGQPEPVLAPEDQATGPSPEGNAPGDQPRPEVESPEESEGNAMSARLSQLEQRLGQLENRVDTHGQQLKANQI